MSASEIIAIVSIVSGSAVAILGPLVAARLEDARTERQINASRIDELRGVLEEAASAMVRAIASWEDVLTDDRNWYGQQPRTDDEVRGAIERASEDTVRVRQVEERLAVRLGHFHPLTEDYAEARRLLVELDDHCRLVIAGKPSEIDGCLHDVANEHYMYFCRRCAAVVGPVIPAEVRLPPSRTEGESSQEPFWSWRG